MKASDTRLSLDELCVLKSKHVTKHEDYRPDIMEYVFAVRDKQAEISFNAGIQDTANLVAERVNRNLKNKEFIRERNG